jgi:hypothetical protein
MKRSRDTDRKPRLEVRAAGYERPAIVSREKLEVIAAVCSPGKASGQPGDCFLNTNS